MIIVVFPHVNEEITDHILAVKNPDVRILIETPVHVFDPELGKLVLTSQNHVSRQREIIVQIIRRVTRPYIMAYRIPVADFSVKIRRISVFVDIVEYLCLQRIRYLRSRDPMPLLFSVHRKR